MLMDIDQTGRDDPTTGVENLSRIRCWNIRLQECDFSLAYRNVHRAIDFLARVQNTAAFDDEIVLGGYAKRYRYSGESKRGCKKLTAIHGGDYTLSRTLACTA